MTRYLSVADIMALHDEMRRRTGYAPAPLRDEGLLESATLRPQMAAHYEQADFVRQAALLAIGISQDQPYLDGNKRTAFLAAVVFLRRNGRPFQGDRLELARRLEAVSRRPGSLEAATQRFEDWLRQNV
ncbi:MAG: type II toxin-antitoxin system death-on-curing family toxin [Chloroflexi bacterium]|nr:type II toxin-antitoxin system death-on-curing family toxin [Chloroflexota bacterium]